jgi:hypothetical protein
MMKKALICMVICSVVIFNCSKKNITNNYYLSLDRGAIVGFVYPPNSGAKITAFLGIEVESTYIDTTGYFKLSDLSIGTYSLLVQAEGYFDYQSKPYISVTGGATVSMDTIRLTSIHDLISSVWPYNRAEQVRLEESIRISFRRWMNTESVERAFHLVPEAEGEFYWYGKGVFGSNELYFVPRGQFASNTQYNVTVDTTASDFEGIRLSEPYQFSFTTEPIKITYTRPRNEETWVDPHTPVLIIFNAYMNPESVILAFKMVDSELKDVTGKFFWYDQREMTFQPDSALALNETYTVTIDTNAKDISGGTLNKPYNFWFKTRPY